MYFLQKSTCLKHLTIHYTTNESIDPRSLFFEGQRLQSLEYIYDDVVDMDGKTSFGLFGTLDDRWTRLRTGNITSLKFSGSVIQMNIEKFLPRRIKHLEFTNCDFIPLGVGRGRYLSFTVRGLRSILFKNCIKKLAIEND